MFTLILFLLAAPLIAQPKLVWSTPYGSESFITPDSRNVLSVGPSGVSVVDAETGVRQYDLHESFSLLSFSEDGGAFLARNRSQGFIERYEVGTSRLLQRSTLRDSYTYAVSGDGKWMCSWDTKNVVVWDLTTLDTVMTLKQDGLKRVAISNGGKRIACTFGEYDDRPAMIYNVGEYLPRMSVGAGEIFAAFSQTADTIYTTTFGGLLTMWDVKTGNRLKQDYWSLFPGGSSSLQLGPNGDVLVCGYAMLSSRDLSHIITLDGRTHFTNRGDTARVLHTSGMLSTYTVPQFQLIDERAVAIDSASVNRAKISEAGDVVVWITREGCVLRSYWRSGRVDTLLSSINPEYFGTLPNVDLIVGKVNANYTCWDLATGRVTSSFTRPGPYSPVQLTDSTLWLVLNDTLEVRQLLTGDLQHRVTFDATFHSSPVCLPKSNKIIGSYTDKTLRAVDIRTGTEIWSIPSYSGSYHKYVVSQSERMFAVLVSDTVHHAYIHAAADGALLRVLKLKYNAFDVEAMFHPDERRFIVTTKYREPNTNVWDITTGDSVVVMRPEQKFMFSPTLLSDGVTLLTTDWGTTISRWNIETGSLTRSPNVTMFRREDYQQLIIDRNETMLAFTQSRNSEVIDINNDTTIAILPGFLPRAFDRTSTYLVAVSGPHSIPSQVVSSLQVWDVRGQATSISELTKGRNRSAIMVSPNPITTASSVSVQFASSTDQTLTLTDLTGRPILSFTGSGTLEPQEFTIERTQLPAAGTYYLKATDSTSSVTTSLILTL